MSRFGLLVLVLSVLLVVGVGLVVALNRETGDGNASDTTIPTSTSSSAASTTEQTTSTTSTNPSTSTSVDTTSSITSPPTSTPTVPPTTTPPSATTQPPAPPYEASITTVAAADLSSSWRSGCPVAVEDLRLVTLTHWNYDGRVQTGRIVVAANLAEQVAAIFHDLYESNFPIQRMEPVEAYGGDDDSSMAANNTSGFNCRQVTDGSTFSEHSYGRAIDVNPLVNPYVRGSTILPPAGAAYADRSRDAPGMIHAGDEVTRAFGSRGWIWGGTWSSTKDYQHFSTTGR